MNTAYSATPVSSYGGVPVFSGDCSLLEGPPPINKLGLTHRVSTLAKDNTPGIIVFQVVLLKENDTNRRIPTDSNSNSRGSLGTRNVRRGLLNLKSANILKRILRLF